VSDILTLQEAEALGARVLAAIGCGSGVCGCCAADRALVVRTLDRLRRHQPDEVHRCPRCEYAWPCDDYSDALADLAERAELYGETQ
jgi:hypothetical protein